MSHSLVSRLSLSRSVVRHTTDVKLSSPHSQCWTLKPGDAARGMVWVGLAPGLSPPLTCLFFILVSGSSPFHFADFFNAPPFTSLRLTNQKGFRCFNVHTTIMVGCGTSDMKQHSPRWLVYSSESIVRNRRGSLQSSFTFCSINAPKTVPSGIERRYHPMHCDITGRSDR